MSFSQIFSYQINDAEREESLRFQNDTSSSHGGRRYFSYIFMVQGVSMQKGVING